ncbi:hypothetical protein IFM89_026478, partial [Coptis chinensis]
MYTILVDNINHSAGNSAGRSWPFSSIFRVGEPRMPSSESSGRKSYSESVPVFEQPFVIQLREPRAILRPSENQTEQEAVEIILIKLLLKSYYDIVRKNIQDLVPKTIMYFLVNHTKRDLLGTFIQNLYRENLFEEMLEEQEEVAAQRKQTQNMFQVLQQAVQVCCSLSEHKQRIIDHVLATLAKVLEKQGNEGHQVQSPPVQNEVVVTPPQSTLNVSPTNAFTPSKPSRRKLAQRNRREKELISGRSSKRTIRNLEAGLQNIPVSMSSH